ncbi:MAG: hypothetical protein GTO02_21960, partial [Candidatus Dadabacteria bacterium]|nr:hypothetical protein [Candidatus Dadabacteria bacterium]
MNVDYIAQPETQLGSVLTELLDMEPPASRIVFVSAFVSLQTIMRIKHQVSELNNNGVDIRFVLGIDLGGTSQEVLNEILEWNIDARIVKHRRPGHTFHPKLYLFEWDDHALIIIGSNNITEGGFFGNYEGAARITYEFPRDTNAFTDACEELGRFLEPDGTVSYQLTKELLTQLSERGDVPTESEARQRRNFPIKSKGTTARSSESLFGVEDIAPPP